MELTCIFFFLGHKRIPRVSAEHGPSGLMLIFHWFQWDLIGLNYWFCMGVWYIPLKVVENNQFYSMMYEGWWVKGRDFVHLNVCVIFFCCFPFLRGLIFNEKINAKKCLRNELKIWNNKKIVQKRISSHKEKESIENNLEKEEKEKLKPLSFFLSFPYLKLFKILFISIFSHYSCHPVCL